MAKKKKWIKKAIKRKGALHRALNVEADEKIPLNKLNKAAKAKGHLGKEARLAKTLKSFHKKRKKK